MPFSASACFGTYYNLDDYFATEQQTKALSKSHTARIDGYTLRQR